MRKRKFLNKTDHCSVISELSKVNVFLNGFKSYEICVYTDDQSKPNHRALGLLISKEICMWWTRFYRPIRDGFCRILPEVSDPRRGKKRITTSGNEIANSAVWPVPYACAQPYQIAAAVGLSHANEILMRTKQLSITATGRGDMVVRMCKVLAIPHSRPRSQGTTGSADENSHTAE